MISVRGVARAAVVAALALLGPLAGEGRAAFEFILHGSETLTVDTNYNNGYLWDTSGVRITHGGLVHVLYAYESSTVDISDGLVSSLGAFDSSTVAVSGGLVTYLGVNDSSSVSISGGEVGDLTAASSRTVDISGGSLDHLLAEHSSTVAISGGSMNHLGAYDNSTVTLYGRDFSLANGLLLDGDRVLGTGLLSGEWFDGTPWTVNIEANGSGATILAIPEPATLALLALGGAAMMARRKRRK